MARPNNSINLRLISKVSTLYYHQNLKQQEIADRLQLSRPKISRLLKQAREQGIVKITVNVPNSNYIDTETLLEEKYLLKEVLIVDIDTSDGFSSAPIIKKQLGQSAADFLLRTISEGDVIGVTWGTTLQGMIDALLPNPIKGTHVIQTLGGVGPPEAKAHSTDISRRLSQLLDSRLTLLPAPGIVDSEESKEVLLADRRVNTALELFGKINIAYVGIGAISTNLVLKKESFELSADLQDQIIQSDAVGDVGLNFFDINGKPVITKFQDLFIGMSLEQYKQVDTVVGIAGGAEKTDAIYGALNGGFIDVLITDQNTAQKLAER